MSTSANRSGILGALKASVYSNKIFRIVIYGDSTVSSEWIHPNWGEILEYVLKTEVEKSSGDKPNMWMYPWWNIRVINSGLNGAKTDMFLKRFDPDVLFYKPDLLILVAGDNDVDEVSKEKYVENHRLLVDKATESIGNVFYVTSIYTGSMEHNRKYKEYVEELKQLFPYRGVELIDLFGEYSKLAINKFYTLQVGDDEKFLTDGKGGNFDLYHPNRLGHAYIAQIILSKIFQIEFNPSKYTSNLSKEVKYPNY